MTIATTRRARSVTQPTTLDDAFRFACPLCRGPLPPNGPDAVRCPADGLTFAREDGIWRFLPPERQAHFATFVREYETVRREEGRGSRDPAYYRALPFQDTTGRFTRDWRIRAASFQTLIDRVVALLEAGRGAPLTVLDLGAGNGWLANRLALRGHHVAAVDLQTNAWDGLGAHRHYASAFVPIQAEFDRLPLAADQVDLVVFNGSLHYAADVESAIAGALRVLRPDGLLAIVDSPMYRDPASGAAMVREREAHFVREFGFPSNAVPMESYLTDARLAALAARRGLAWTRHRPRHGLAWAVRPWRARLTRSREPARFLVVVGRRVAGGEPLSHPRLRGLWRRCLALALPVRRRRLSRPVLERAAGHPILVLPGVFNPRLTRSGELLARTLDERLIPPGCRVLDMGTGSGIGAVAAARWASRVVAVDVNPVAVRCARINALLNGVEERVQVSVGDLFAPVRDERFDVVLFNPPYFRGQPRDAGDHAWRSVDVVERFAAGLEAHLAPEGHALVVLSTDGDQSGFLAAFGAHGFEARTVARRDVVNEVLTVYRLTPGRAGA